MSTDLPPPPRRTPLESPMSHTLIFLPDDTAKPILDAPNGARRALDILMFLFTDPILLG
jgi:hypothetical protein